MSVSGLAAYITKYPVCAEVLKPDWQRPGRDRLEADQSKNSARLVLALVEARRRFGLSASVRGVGEGGPVRTAWKRLVNAQLFPADYPPR